MKEPWFILATCWAFRALDFSPGLGVIYPEVRAKAEGEDTKAHFPLKFPWALFHVVPSPVDKSTGNFTA